MAIRQLDSKCFALHRSQEQNMADFPVVCTGVALHLPVFWLVLGVDEAWRALQTMKAMHALGLIHRDVKLENIFICDDDTLKLGDFGLTMSMCQEMAISPVGTVEYMSPEVSCLPLVQPGLSSELRRPSRHTHRPRPASLHSRRLVTQVSVCPLVVRAAPSLVACPACPGGGASAS
jgi:Protein kinase domain